MTEQVDIVCASCLKLKDPDTEEGFIINFKDVKGKHSVTVWLHDNCTDQGNLDKVVFKLRDFLLEKRK